MSPSQIDPDLFSPDLLEFLALLARHDVQYLLVGGHAAIIHGHPRVTGDMDIFYDLARKNCEHLFAALQSFWSGDIPGMQQANELEQPGIITQFGRPPSRLDLINQIDGVSFAAAWSHRETYELPIPPGIVLIPVLSRNDFILNKKASGRPKDLDDVQALEDGE